MIICSGDKWSFPPPICIRKGCDEIQSTGNVTITEEKNGAVLEFKCAPPLILTGEKMITCDGATWSAQIPSCKYVEPGKYCDFEDENICGWQHDKLANFEWKWNSGTTPTRRTGPKYDHTLGKGRNGHYMFMESSSPIEMNDKARLLSPYFPATTGGLCFEIWYHMLGPVGYNQVGRLKIYIGEMGQTDILSQKAEFEVFGNQGDEWIKGQFPVGERKTSFMFIIEGTKLKSHLSDISVDDPKLYNCSDDFKDSTLSNRETTTIDATDAVMQTTGWTLLNTPRNTFTTMHRRPVGTNKASLRSAAVTELEKVAIELSASLTGVLSTGYRVKTTECLTVNNTKSPKASNITLGTRKSTSPTVTEATTDYQTNSVPVKQSSIVLSSESMTTQEKAKTRMIMKATTIKETTTRETTKLKPITKPVMSIKASTSTTATTNNITTTWKIKTTMNTKSTTFAISTAHKPENTNDVKTTSPTKTSKREPLKRSSIGLTTQGVSFSNKKLEMSSEDTSYSSVKYQTSTEGSPEIVESDDTVKLLMIVIGVGIVIALMIMTSAIYAHHKKRQKECVLWDRGEPIVKNDSIDMYNCGKDSDVGYPFET
ncbi:uncharacterized protein LOC127704265 [Mytilus californianus]|uniref:uncharacterized protein LOC127704265 n=1 Tax=Mytilus californianus TaxID=6549 RepID=UPI002246CFEF|nr:uncharacterized protein LOC127704265 [Mytilus californianus]